MPRRPNAGWCTRWRASSPHGADRAAARGTYVANLRHAAERLAPEGVTAIIEPINTRDIPGYFLNTTTQAMAVIEEVGHPNLQLQLDLYHVQIMEGDLAHHDPGARRPLPAHPDRRQPRPPRARCRRDQLPLPVRSAWTSSAMPAGSAANTAPKPKPAPASAGPPPGASTAEPRDRKRPTQGFGYAVMNLGSGSGGSMIHTEIIQGLRPSGVTSEQLTSNLRPNGLVAWLVTGLFCGWFSNARLSSTQLPGVKPKDIKEFGLGCPDRMIGVQQILGDLTIVEDRVCGPWQLAHPGWMSSRRSVTVQRKGSANSTS